MSSDVAHLRRSAILHAAAICNHVGDLVEGAADPSQEQWGKTTEEEKSESCIGSWRGVTADIKPPNATLRLYGGAAFERVMHEFRCATYSIECPSVSREKAANILLAHAGRGGDRGITEAAAEIARAAARSWLAPLLESACDPLAFVVGNLFDLAAVRNQQCNSDSMTLYGSKLTDMDGYVGYHAALRRTYSCFIKDLAKQCKQIVIHHLDSVTSPYSLVCYENDLLGSFGPSTNSMYMYNHASAGSFGLELSDSAVVLHNDTMKDQENIPPENNAQETMPGKVTEGREARCENLMTVPETPSSDQPTDVNFAIEKELGHCHEIAGRKRYSKTMGINRNIDQPRGLGNENNVQDRVQLIRRFVH